MAKRRVVNPLTRSLSAFVVILFLWVPIATATAGLPVSAAGEPLPSLAPMLERVLPAVVNIATTGRVQVQQNPLSRDPFFPVFFQYA